MSGEKVAQDFNGPVIASTICSMRLSCVGRPESFERTPMRDGLSRPITRPSPGIACRLIAIPILLYRPACGLGIVSEKSCRRKLKTCNPGATRYPTHPPRNHAPYTPFQKQAISYSRFRPFPELSAPTRYRQATSRHVPQGNSSEASRRVPSPPTSRRPGVA